jgi:protocatechuate 3,4-dioxygenase beta subunit
MMQKPLVAGIGLILTTSLAAASGSLTALTPQSLNASHAESLAAQGQGRGGGGRGQGQGQARDAVTQPLGQGTISGTVVSDSGAPVRRARVTLSGAELRGARASVTDDAGAFEFVALPAGRFTMTASKPGYVNNAYGAKRPGRPGTPIQLADGQKIENATISLPRGSVITGVVIDENGEPSPGTQVRVMRYVLRAGERAVQQAGTDTTDDRGIYRVYGLQPGDYMVSAVPRNLSLGALRESIAAEVEALLAQAGAAGGAGGGRGAARGLGGAAGFPAAGARGGQAQALVERAAALQQQLQQQADQEQAVAYAPVYYPGTASPSGAQTVTIGIGDERGGVDFRLQLVPTARVTGVILSPTGSLPAGTQVMLVPKDRGGLAALPGVGNSAARVGGDGRFTFQNVTPGEYSLQARAAIREAPANATEQEVTAAPQGRGGRGGRGALGPITQVLWAQTDLSIAGANPPDVSLTLQPGLTITGRIEFQGGQGDPARVRVNLIQRGQQTLEFGGATPSQVDANGRFTITGVAPGRYAIAANANAGGGRGGGQQPASTDTTQWVLQSVMVNGTDSLDFPFEVTPGQEIGGVVVTFGTTTQELSGVIQDPTGKPTPDYTIVLFAADTRFWTPQSRRISASRPDTNGRFRMANIPPGDYRLTAIVDAEPGEWYDPAFLSQLVGASIPVSIREGEKKVQDIRVAGGGS